LQKNNGKVGFYHVDYSIAEPTVGANRAYLTVPANEESGARSAYFIGDVKPTVVTSLTAIDSLMSGESTIYDLNGKKQNRLAKGMNIVVGKDGSTHKVMVK
jgi:hypothetical protein